MSHAGVVGQVKRLLIVLILAVVAMRANAQPQTAPERRVAFVVGIGAYQNAPRLTNPVNDAKAVGEALRRLNFTVDEIYDADFRQLSRALREFGIKAQQADVAVIYYAGHGVQDDEQPSRCHGRETINYRREAYAVFIASYSDRSAVAV